MVIAFGEVLWDLMPSGKQLGGAPANCAYRLHQLGTSVSLISRLGEDDLGDEARSILKDKALPCPLLQLDKKNPTGTVDVTISPEGDADYVINPDVAYDYIEVNDDLLRAAAHAKAVVFGVLIQRNEVSRNTLYQVLEAAPQALKVLDINLRKDCYSKETIEQSLHYADVLKLNDKEVQVVSKLLGLAATNKEEFCTEVAKRFRVSTTLVSLGKLGVYAYDVNEGAVRIPGYPAEVADTVGAGDNFTAGFIHKRLNGEKLEDACLFANVVGALVATKVGGMPSLSLADIEEYRDSHSPIELSAHS